MILNILFKAINIFRNVNQADIDHKKLDLLLKRRQFFHKDIPDLLTIKMLAGDRFQELQDIINKFDPIINEGGSPKPRIYESLTKTLIFKLPEQHTRENVANLLSLEISLWFANTKLKFEDNEMLIDEIYSYKIRRFHTNPFKKNNYQQE
jgi:hypothetical protein